MRIYFDFDLYGIPDMDSHIADIMLAFKRDIIIILGEYEERIQKDGGFILVTLIPNSCNVGYHLVSDEELWRKVQYILNYNDWGEIIKKFGKADLN